MPQYRVCIHSTDDELRAGTGRFVDCDDIGGSGDTVKLHVKLDHQAIYLSLNRVAGITVTRVDHGK